MQRWWHALGEYARSLGSAAVYATFIVTFIGQVARVDGYSMQPTLQHEDRLIVNKLAYELHAPAVGDVVMLLSPDQPLDALVKRVVAGPGDRVEASDGQVFVNGKALDEPYVPRDYRDHISTPAKPVPPGEYFVLGDHRSSSNDSRTWGTVARHFIYGKAVFSYWPLDRLGTVR